MEKKKIPLIFIIVLGGIAVLGSYALGIMARPGAQNILWGGVPDALRPLYTVNMFLGAAGFFAINFYLLFRVKTTETTVINRYRFGIFNVIFLFILVASALWLPLTVLAVEHSSQILAWVVRLNLAVVALSSIALFIALLTIQPRPSPLVHKIAIAGCTFFCLQTVVLDAIVWAAYFQV